MSSFLSISPGKLARLGTPASPVIIDVSTDEYFGADPRLIPSARRRSRPVKEAKS
jgi:hypothetical protein